MHPEIQQKAQSELQEVVGPDRLPDYDDYDSLHYIRAILLECVRWIPVLPLGVPRKVTQDDYYKGFFIPKGTEIIPVRFRVWSCCQVDS